MALEGRSCRLTTGISPDAGTEDEPALELWSWLPRLPARQVRLEERLGRWTDALARPWIDRLGREMSRPIELGRPEIDWRASGLGGPA